MVQRAALFGFGFGNLAMLGWLAAAAAPLLVHLWSRRRYREVPWAAVAFLLAAVRKNSRRIQLEQWLLLAVRTLVILLVVLALAEPYGQQFGGSVAGGPTLRVLVIDTSLSMATRDGGASRLERAKRLAVELVEHGGPGDRFSLVTLADPPQQPPLGDAWDRAAIVAEINALRQTHGRARLSDTLDAVAAALELGPSERQRFERQEVCFFTDLQRTTWLPESTDPGDRSEPGRPRPRPGRRTARLAQLADQATLVVIDVGSPRTANLAVTELGAREPLITVGRDVAFEATLHEFGDQPRNNCAVELVVDDDLVSQQNVDVPAGGDAAVRFTHRFRDAGEHAVAVRAAADQLDVDNTRRLIARFAERIGVLVVAGRRADARFLADALDPDPTDQSPLHPRIITEGELADTDLAPFACVLLSNVAQLTAGEAQRLAQFARQGRGLAIFLGDRVVADAYNAAAGRDGEPLLPSRLGDVVRESQFGLDPLDYRHPIVAPFRGRDRAGLLTTPIARYFRLEPTDEQRSADTALSTLGGDPLVVAAPLGRGRIVLVATAGSLASVDAATGEPWTAWPTWPSFLPVVREILAYAVGGDQDEWQSMVGTPIGGPLPPNSSIGPMEISRPDGRTAAVSVATTTDGRRWSYADTFVSGSYSVLDPSTGQTQRFAVNPDTQESDLAQLSEKGVRTIFPDNTPSPRNDPTRKIVLTPFLWHRPLLWTALSLVFVELCLAWLFGRGGR